MSLVLQSELRSESGKAAARSIRRRGYIPGVCYGPNVNPFHLSVDPEALVRILHSPKGRNTVFELDVEGERHHVMVQEIQRDPVKRNLLHADFRVVSDEDMVSIEVPVKPIGKSKGEKIGGRLVPVRREVPVRCAVKDIPDCVEFDVSDLDVGETVLASHLTAPEGTSIAFKSDFVVLQVVLPKKTTTLQAQMAGEEGPTLEF